ncbi:hypothetical protein ZIOFF_010704 [Zingiber officinale]|uniref:DEK-C domain-containing protein n=1 Tax=Zingiber officinale TaxID=94328 RepID=A0A8J5LZT1_ZINOF|nr:hypothetical protein ZIOFF_010704 [Zingiber officinale]
MEEELNQKIEAAVVEILRESDMSTTSEAMVRSMASDRLGLDLSSRGRKLFVRGIVESFLASQQDEDEEAAAAADASGSGPKKEEESGEQAEADQEEEEEEDEAGRSIKRSRRPKEFDDEGDLILCRVSQLLLLMKGDASGFQRKDPGVHPRVLYQRRQRTAFLQRYAVLLSHSFVAIVVSLCWEKTKFSKPPKRPLATGFAVSVLFVPIKCPFQLETSLFGNLFWSEKNSSLCRVTCISALVLHVLKVRSDFEALLDMFHFSIIDDNIRREWRSGGGDDGEELNDRVTRAGGSHRGEQGGSHDILLRLLALK